ncbi:hypothetical protein [Alkalihalobacillus sp. TS-13]|uniref:hypothetical protein n=1 Tax=Alkalihalobacillus sp. TS-13 TaxID=2842455 RepID=UPI001C86FB6E|nr:hypothetical protein [Alkalihalobacillus sp. TS-13]
MVNVEVSRRKASKNFHSRHENDFIFVLRSCASEEACGSGLIQESDVQLSDQSLGSLKLPAAATH